MAGPTQTKTGEYLKMMAKMGHASQKLGEAALALTEVYCKSDDGMRQNLGDQLATQMYHVLHIVYKWDQDSARKAAAELRVAFSNVALHEEEDDT